MITATNVQHALPELPTTLLPTNVKLPHPQQTLIVDVTLNGMPVLINVWNAMSDKQVITLVEDVL
jgi:hypothetical protein